MVHEIKLPELGENITSGTISRVLVSVGDMVGVDQPVLEVESEKAVVEVPSPVAGTVMEIRVKAGQIVNVGETILLLAVEEHAAVKESEQKAAMPPPEKVERRPAPETAKKEALKPKAAPPREKRPAEAPERERARPSALWEKSEQGAGAPAPASPSVRRIARELGVDIKAVTGSGPGGRISAEDVQAFAQGEKREERPAQPPAEPAEAPAETKAPEKPTGKAAPVADRWGEIERVPMSAVRRRTAQQIGGAWRTIPHVTHFDRADATLLESFRDRFKGQVETHGGRLTVTVILTKIVAFALKRFPQFNASVDMETEEILRKKYVNIGIAVDTQSGLLVPVIRDADAKGIVTMAVEIGHMAERARQRKLAIEDMQGGTFTITNLGGIGGSDFTPIINAPEVAILGVSRARVEPVPQNGFFVPRPMLPLALSYDHRVIDGADAARFVRFLVDAIEQPYTLLLEEMEQS